MPPAIVRWKLRRTVDGYEGMVTLPLSLAQASARGVPLPLAQYINSMPPGLKQKPMSVKASGATKASALAKAAGLASMLADNPLLQAVMPPGTANAVAAIKFLSKNPTAKAATKLVGKGAKRLKKALKFW